MQCLLICLVIPNYPDNHPEKMPYLDEHFAKHQNISPQELLRHIGWQIQREIFFSILIFKAKPAKTPTELVHALCKLVSSTSEVA